jgi:hypothetical protein
VSILKEIFFALLAAFALLVAFIFFEATVTTTFYKESGKPIREIDLAQMKQLKRGQLTIYFFPEHQTLGQEVADVLEQAWRIVRERLALDLGRFGVAVVLPKAGEEIGGVRLQRKIWALWDPIVPVLTSPNLQSLQQADRDTLIQIYSGCRLHEKHGEGVIKTFWQRLSQRGFPSAKEAARILSELTGEDIWAKLQKMDLHEVLRTLEQAGTQH